MLLEFRKWSDAREREAIHIDPLQVSSVREYQDRHAYGGNNDVSEISMNNGDKFRVYGHVAKKIVNCFAADEV